MTTTNHDTMTGLERTVPVDTDRVKDESPPILEEVPAAGDAAADNDKRTDACDEAKAADEAPKARSRSSPIARTPRTRTCPPQLNG